LLVDEASDPTSIEDVVVASSNTTDDVRAGLEQSSAEDRHDFDQHEKQPQHSGQQNLVPAHREIESLLFTPGAAFSGFEWEAGLLLILRQKYFLTYEALLFVSQSIHEHYSRNMAIVQVELQNTCKLLV
jgi:hypothetical protein